MIAVVALLAGCTAAEAPAADLLLHPNIGYYAGHDAEYRRRARLRAR